MAGRQQGLSHSAETQGVDGEHVRARRSHHRLRFTTPQGHTADKRNANRQSGRYRARVGRAGKQREVTRCLSARSSSARDFRSLVASRFSASACGRSARITSAIDAGGARGMGELRTGAVSDRDLRAYEHPHALLRRLPARHRDHGGRGGHSP